MTLDLPRWRKGRGGRVTTTREAEECPHLQRPWQLQERPACVLPPHPRPPKVLLPATLPQGRVLTDAVVDARLRRGDIRDRGTGGQLWLQALHTGWGRSRGKG